MTARVEAEPVLLQDLRADALAPELGDGRGRGDGAEAVAEDGDLYAMFTRHPWLVQAFATHLFHGEGKARHDDHNLAVYEAGGFAGPAADRAAAAVFTYVLGNAAPAAATAALTRRIERDGQDAEEVFAATMKEAAEVAVRFPRLRSRIEAGAAEAYAEGPGDTFAFGLAALLDGLERGLRTPGTTAGG
ncbi:TetR/AcrR family transcriptional regulator C-terminal domain-containing protein [Streptomyces venezuelae ATCC 10712]